MEVIASAILITWKRNGAYALRLVGDLAPEQWIAQPVPGRTMNHPGWIFAHLNVYAPIATAMLRGESFEDMMDHRYGQKSKVVNNPAEYPPPEVLITEYQRLHADAERALESAHPEIFLSPTPLERWRTMHPRTGEMLVTLMVKHETGHLGQLSAWRRAMGLTSVPM